MDAAPAPHLHGTVSTAAVLVCATDDEVGRQAMRHAVRLFGPDQRYVDDVPALRGTDVGSICAAVEELGGVAVVLGIDADDRTRATSTFALGLVRRCPCPVVVVAVPGSECGPDRAAADAEVSDVSARRSP